MSTQVLALKYRPKKFEDLIGQDTISTTLCLALDSNRLSNAYLFSGLRGSGKTSTARIMAKALVCDNAPTSKPCEICDACISANENRHLDIIEMDGASNRGIDDIKDLIEHTKYKPTSAKFKVFIIDEVHMLTTQAFNALLKTLEEPPEFVKFILATTDPLKLPATILSRTQHFRFKKISPKNVHHHLTHILNLESITYESEALDILIRAGDGSLRDTLTLLDQAIIYAKGHIDVVSVTDMMGMIDPLFMSELFDVVLKKGDITDILNELESYEAGQVLDEMSIYLKYAMLKKDMKFDIYMFDRFFRILGDSKQLLSINSDGGFVLILTLNKLIEATNLKTIDDAIQQIETTQQSIEVKQAIQTPLPSVKSVEPTIQTPPQIPQPTPSPSPVIDDLYSKVIAKVYDRSEELGSCFEDSFKFNSYTANTLIIDSSASGDCKKMLFKHFAKIREFIEDIYGQDTNIDFNKIQPKELP
jgi:DNA polymerase-3 subunit gamma/tau